MNFAIWLESLKPRVFYKGFNKGDARRIQTGMAFWDGLFFVADNIKSAQAYGNDIIKVVAKPEAKILYHGTREFRSVAKGIPRMTKLGEFCDIVARRAQQLGYDAVWFERQTDVGTAIINKDKFVIEND
jgi:hypothetical protein